MKFTTEARADLARLDLQLARRVFNKLHRLVENFEFLVPEPLTGDWKGVYKLRIGDYRALYTFDKMQLLVHFIRHRREVYKIK
ncbi:MAG: type II toxin-antitoxin system mRNA interferase toxin, RelE/StbE family [Chloroflexi bacterium]|nr:type II toxin-antitoxin system mRNA interferase toxin, RelE/StbE family [Chloroflexota bacterium]